MRTARSSSRPGGGGLNQAPPPDQTPPGPGTAQTRHPPRDQTPHAPPPPVDRMTDRCKHITLPQTSFAGGKNYKFLFTQGQLDQKIKINI